MINDINTKLTDFSEKFNELSSKYDTIFSKLQPCKSDNFHRLTMIMQLECNSVTNGQWSRRDTFEINLVSPEMHEDVLEKNVCKSLSLIGLMLFMKILHTFHCTNRSVRKIIKFKYRKQKQSLMHKRKIYSLNLMVFWRILFCESMLHENQQFPCKCQQFESSKKIRSTWFFNNLANVKLTELGRIHRVYDATDILRISWKQTILRSTLINASS